jgi:hypothetical protein
VTVKELIEQLMLCNSDDEAMVSLYKGGEAEYLTEVDIDSVQDYPKLGQTHLYIGFVV